MPRTPVDPAGHGELARFCAAAACATPMTRTPTTERTFIVSPRGSLVDDHGAGPWRRSTETPRMGSVAAGIADDGVGVGVGGDHHHPDAHVEGAVHLVAGHVAGALELREEVRNRPGRALHHRVEYRWQRPVEIAGQPAARNVGHRVY